MMKAIKRRANTEQARSLEARAFNGELKGTEKRHTGRTAHVSVARSGL